MTTPTVLHLRCHPAPPPDRRLLAVLTAITPVVQLLPRDGALLDVGGALRYWQRTPDQLADLVQTRLLAQTGRMAAVGGGPTRMIATMAVDTCPPGTARIITPQTSLAFLREQPLRALPGVGPVLARRLGTYGLRTVGDLADLPLATLQRITGAAVGRQLHDRATAGFDPRPVTPATPGSSITCTQSFAHDELDPQRQRRAVLALACETGTTTRANRSVATRLTLTVRYADHTESTRSKTLTEPTAHTPALTAAAYQLHAALGLQRARVRSFTLRADLRPAHASTRQLSLDPADDRGRRIETVIDRAQTRYGTHIIGPATLA